MSVQADLLNAPLEQVADYVVRTLQHWDADQTPVTLVECLPPDDTAILPLLSPTFQTFPSCPSPQCGDTASRPPPALVGSPPDFTRTSWELQPVRGE